MDKASRGEDVLITVRGKVKARLTRSGIAVPAKLGAEWAKELRALAAVDAGIPGSIAHGGKNSEGGTRGSRLSLNYWDTSALVKIYVFEPDSDVFLELMRRPNSQFVPR